MSSVISGTRSVATHNVEIAQKQQAQSAALAAASQNLPNPAQDPAPAPGPDAAQGGSGVQDKSFPPELDFKTTSGDIIHLTASWAKSTGQFYDYDPQTNTYALESGSHTFPVYTDKDRNPYIVNEFKNDRNYEDFSSLELDPKAPKGAETQIRSIASKIQVVNLTTGKVLVTGQPVPQNAAQAAPAPSYWQSFKGWVNERVDETLGTAYPDGETERYLREIDQAPSTMRYRVARTLQGPIDLPRVVEVPFRLFGMNGDDIRTVAATQAFVGGSGSDTLAKAYLLYDQFSLGVWDRTSGGVPHDQSRKLSVDNFMGDVPMMLPGLTLTGIKTANEVMAVEEAWQVEQATLAAANRTSPAIQEIFRKAERILPSYDGAGKIPKLEPTAGNLPTLEARLRAAASNFHQQQDDIWLGMGQGVKYGNSDPVLLRADALQDMRTAQTLLNEIKALNGAESANTATAAAKVGGNGQAITTGTSAPVPVVLDATELLNVRVTGYFSRAKELLGSDGLNGLAPTEENLRPLLNLINSKLHSIPTPVALPGSRAPLQYLDETQKYINLRDAISQFIN